MYIDAGVNLTSSQFQGDIERVLSNASTHNVSNLLLIGCDLTSSRDSLSLAQQYNLLSTAGIHPHDAKGVDDTFINTLKQLHTHPEVVAVGECGLDYNRDFSPRPIQRHVFEQQLVLAESLNKPVYLHERDAFTDQSALLKAHSVSGVLHCFTGDRTALRFYLDYGLYIGITGWVCDERRGQALQELIQYIPEDRLLLETDAPYLIPRTIKPKPKSRRNEPAYIYAIADTIAQLKGTSGEVIAQHAYDNFHRLFLEGAQ